jgi:hypothetical protein
MSLKLAHEFKRNLPLKSLPTSNLYCATEDCKDVFESLSLVFTPVRLWISSPAGRQLAIDHLQKQSPPPRMERPIFENPCVSDKIMLLQYKKGNWETGVHSRLPHQHQLAQQVLALRGQLDQQPCSSIRLFSIILQNKNKKTSRYT